MFNYNQDELFGRYCLIEQKYGVPNEKFLYKVINTLNCNSWSDVPVDFWDKDRKLHNHCEQVVNVICCGGREDKVERYRLCDVELLQNDLQTQLDHQKAMWNKLKEWVGDNTIENNDSIDPLSTKIEQLFIAGKLASFENIKNKMQELEKGEKDGTDR